MKDPQGFTKTQALAKQSSDNVLVKENKRKQFFEFMEASPADYSKLSFTESEETRIRRHLSHLSTGSTAAIPIYCAGARCPFAHACPLLPINKAPLGQQCQPPGTLVLTSNRGYVPIEDLDPQYDRVVSYILGKNILRVRGQAIQKTSRQYTGNLIRLTTAHHSHDCTSDHICLARWNAKSENLFAVYLMQKGSFWRVGKTKLHMQLKSGHNHSGLAFRGRSEKADRMWLLGVYSTNTEALLAEEFFSTDGQIAKSCFVIHEKNKTKWNGLYKWITQEQLDQHHQRLVKDIGHYERFLERHGLDIKYPVWTYHDQEIGQSKKYGTMNMVMKIRACNLVSDYMDVPIVDKLVKQKGKKNPTFTPVTITRHPYQGPVYSLNVEEYHTYISNGIITGNCLIEAELLTFWRKKYIIEYDIDIDSMTEVSTANELAEIELLLWRVNTNLSKPEYAELVQDDVVAIDREGNVMTKKSVSSLMDVREKLTVRKSRLVKLMVGDRQEKYKREAALKIREEDDPSTSAADLRRNLQRLVAQVQNQRTQQLPPAEPGTEQEGQPIESEVEKNIVEEPLTPDLYIVQMLEGSLLPTRGPEAIQVIDKPEESKESEK